MILAISVMKIFFVFYTKKANFYVYFGSIEIK